MPFFILLGRSPFVSAGKAALGPFQPSKRLIYFSSDPAGLDELGRRAVGWRSSTTWGIVETSLIGCSSFVNGYFGGGTFGKAERDQRHKKKHLRNVPHWLVVFCKWLINWTPVWKWLTEAIKAAEKSQLHEGKATRLQGSQVALKDMQLQTEDIPYRLFARILCINCFYCNHCHYCFKADYGASDTVIQ